VRIGKVFEVVDRPYPDDRHSRRAGGVHHRPDIVGHGSGEADVVAPLLLQEAALGAEVVLHVDDEQRRMLRPALRLEGREDLVRHGAGATVPHLLQVRNSSDWKKLS